MTARLLAILRESLVVIEGERDWIDPSAPDLFELPVDRLLNLVYYWAIRNGDEAAIRTFDARLWVPPKGVAPTEGPWSAEAETSAFRAFAKQVKGDTPPEVAPSSDGKPRSAGIPVRARTRGARRSPGR